MAYRSKSRRSSRRSYYPRSRPSSKRRSYRSSRRSSRTTTRTRRSGAQTLRIVVEQPTSQLPSLPLGLTVGNTTKSGPKF